jgi:RNA recognition motif-containing protein
MISRKLILIVFIVFYSRAFSQAPLEKAFEKLEKKLTKRYIKHFKNTEENLATAEAHMDIGLYIHNFWIRNKSKPELIQFFDSLEIYHPDDISNIILTSFHRKLNNKPIRLEEQVNKIQAYWKPIIECEIKRKENAKLNYARYKEGDTITLKQPIMTRIVEKRVEAVIYMCPHDYVLSENKEGYAIFKCVIKYKYEGRLDFQFVVEIIEVTPPGIRFMLKDTYPKREIDIELMDVNILPPK